MTNIDSSTPIHDFPEIYNANLQEFSDTIDGLRAEIEVLRSENQALKEDLRKQYSKFVADVNKIIGEKFDDIDGRLHAIEDSIKNQNN